MRPLSARGGEDANWQQAIERSLLLKALLIGLYLCLNISLNMLNKASHVHVDEIHAPCSMRCMAAVTAVTDATAKHGR